ncbi:unnamed protein product [Chondrus crispus]|uniref:UBA domain-containing protein n=1 Tax=Chondrus crispus TaxID=2769 RepID=R7QRK6_CHOCR|nr:unnamed protein product [Chondrus crispus]CDF40126.1 unnamed protein product [Chondrus crispus]|eukprot:XP_005710420.1 unnamed protein product [Chondrus crispus]
MLESVLADVLTRVLGQYLEGIDRDSVRFGAWSGLVELRGVALRPEALAVLFETLGMDLPVTVEAGFIGLLRLQVPWKAIGSTPVQIHMSDITIMARPVCGDGSDDSELKMRERRIKRAKLATDDAVREASWGVANEAASQGWGNWLVSEELRAKIVDNIQVQLSGISLRFEDPFSDPARPYIVSMVCKSLKAVSANELWEEAFVERSSDAPQSLARKLVEVKGFHIDWAPITPRDSPGLSRGTKNPGDQQCHFDTPEMLKQFMSADSSSNANGQHAAHGVKSLLQPVDGFMRLRLSRGASSPAVSQDATEPEPAADLDIRFPNISVDLDDVQYASLLQTSVYFARLATRGFRPKTPAERWAWAIDQMLPGFSNRREQALRFTEDGISKARGIRLLYAGYRKTILKSRRMGIEEPQDISGNLERLEDSMSFGQVTALRDYVDLQIEAEGETWLPAPLETSTAQEVDKEGTTMSSFWSMLGYKEEKSPPDLLTASGDRIAKSSGLAETLDFSSSDTARESQSQIVPSLALRVAFLLRGASVRLFQKGFPNRSIPRVSMNLHDLRVGILYTGSGSLTMEAVLGSIDAWDMRDGRRMVYSKQAPMSDMEYEELLKGFESSYPHDVLEAIESIRNGSNPAKDLITEGDEFPDDETGHLPGDHYFGAFEEQNDPQTSTDIAAERKGTGSRSRGNSGIRESTPPSFRVTEREFLGTSRQSQGTQKYVAAFRYSQTMTTASDVKNVSESKLDVSVATLEAIVDGPQGSFVWGLKFWQPKGMAQDPIMAFLGAAAGQRIAELRMEIETALLANRVPLEINAVILAPRFVFPSSEENQPAIVVNMGVLGICTSDNAPEHQSDSEKRGCNIRYSNYVLTLDDLGMYFVPNLMTAVSQEIRTGTRDHSVPIIEIGFKDAHYIDTTHVERIIRPFSLRFLLQTLRDASVVQVAHSPSGTNENGGSQIAKVRVRGNVPGLSLIVTQDSVQHFIVEGQRWVSEMKTSSDLLGSTSKHPSGDNGWQPLVGGNDDALTGSIVATTQTRDEHREGVQDLEPTQPTMMASYDVKSLIQRVSVEVRDSTDVRLVTAVASVMRASIVKTGRTKLQADFSLRNWIVTDGSRGSTAAFRRLVYAGALAAPKAVSSPRTTMSAKNEHHSYTDRKHFATIRYEVDLIASEHKVHLRFLCLNMVCVRETYVRLASFFHKVSKRAKQSIRDMKSSLRPNDHAGMHPTSSGPLDYAGEAQPEIGNALSKSKVTVTSEFDGFSLQLVASGGALALVEMKDSKIHFSRNDEGHMKVFGGFRYISVRDWTAPIADHTNVITYEKIPQSNVDVLTPSDPNAPPAGKKEDKWTLLIPKSRKEPCRFHACFGGIRICFLYRFSVVLKQYFSVFLEGVKPAVDVVLEQVGDLGIGQEGPSRQSHDPATSRKIVTDVELNDLAIRVPRHSGCASEAMLVNLSAIHVSNLENITKDSEWHASFRGVNFAVNYLLSPSDGSSGRSKFTSPFLQDLSAKMVLRRKPPENKVPQLYAANLSSFIDIEVKSHVEVALSEAQYTVLYFILTENLVETISGNEMSTDIEVSSHSLSQEETGALGSAEYRGGFNENPSKHLEELSIPPLEAQAQELIVLDVNMEIPSLSVEISRGWDVEHEPCKVIGMYSGGVKVDLTYRKPSHLLFELSAELHSAIDLRQERARPSPFAVPLVFGGDSSSSNEQRENVTVTYEKHAGQRPSIVMFFRSLQTLVVPELLRDLAFLAIPGWPYLRTSSFAPEIAYLGRTLTVVLGSSQVLLSSEEHEGDDRGIVLTGDFQLKVDWMRGSGAKRISVQSTQLEMSVVSELPEVEKNLKCKNLPSYHAQRFSRSQTPLLYPTDSLIEYIGPKVDESGCRVDICVDSILCLVNAADIPLLRAVSSRPNRMKPSYLVRRDWKQASVIPSRDGLLSEPSPKEQRNREARKNLAVAVNIPAARFLITDESDGRFVPIMETRFKSFSISAHMGNMLQTEGEVAMDLFNTKKGWWEPALESWFLAASMSYGKSGTRAIVIKSEKRLNLNVTPTSVTAAMAVARSLKSATKLRKDSSASSSTKKIQSSEAPQYSQHSKEGISPRRPSVAAFLVRNELGLPIAMSITRTSRGTTIAHNSEVEVGVQTEELLHASENGPQKSRSDALRCYVFIARFAVQELSASEVGKQYITLVPQSKREGDQGEQIRILWEVEMINGVPVGTIRSLYRIMNNTKNTLVLRVVEEGDGSDKESDCRQYILQAGQYYSQPMFESDKTMLVRPLTSGRVEETLSQQENAIAAQELFTWSSALPGISWLANNANEFERNEDNRRRSTAATPRVARIKRPTVCCRSAQTGISDFYISVAARCPVQARKNSSKYASWVDVSLHAPIILENSLPSCLSYRITQRYIPPTDQSQALLESDGPVLAAGIISPLEDAHLHFAGEKLSSTFLSLAYENSTDPSHASSSSGDNLGLASRASFRFGPEVSFENIRSKKAAVVLPSAERTVDSKGQPRRDFRAAIRLSKKDGRRYQIFAGFWIRNRSDTAVHVCSRNSFYGAGSQQFYLRHRPPVEQPDAFVCLEGPYLSIRLPPEPQSETLSRPELVDHSDWWTTPSTLEDITKPLRVNIRGRSLELEVRPAVGLEACTSVITIRNSAWLCNNTAEVLQWCQSAAVDSHGNCRTRFLNTLQPSKFQGIHWSGKPSREAVRLRLANNDGHSDWIWSPSIPLHIGHSRELPAKMYRPKTHEQYIARVASKPISGTSTAIVVYPEDRQNPPYRIVNLCRDRAVAFSQIESQERPWLVRAGKTSRYSWDNPLASSRDRFLSIRILEKEELNFGTGSSRSESSSSRGSGHLHEERVLNIDVVGERVMELKGSYVPSVIVHVSVDCATKIVTFSEEDSTGQVLMPTSKAGVASVIAEANPDPVLVVGWDDIGQQSDSVIGQPNDGDGGDIVSDAFDYPASGAKYEVAASSKGSRVDTDAALFLDSIGISVITCKPAELMYICFKGVMVNYEAYNELECLALRIQNCQVDNQLLRTPYPVLLWVPTSFDTTDRDGNGASSAKGRDAVSFELQRKMTDDDILMINSFQGAVHPFNICFEDELISEMLAFLADTSIMGASTSLEPLVGSDTEKRDFEHGLYGSRNARIDSGGPSEGSAFRQSSIPSSKRIYVRDFKLLRTALRLTSSGSGTAVAKAAGINASARALVALVLNVENCEFLFPTLHVQHVFDSLHHFALLVRKSYETHLSNQRMNLLASNALVGNPAALFDAVGTGARELFNEPGKAKDSAEFIAKVGRGSKSLFSQTVGGLVDSVSSLPRAVSSGLERAVGDSEYLAERGRIRGSQLSGGQGGSSVKNPAQGLATGAVSFAHGISSGVTGFIREPMQGAKQGGTGGFFKGIGKAFIGGVAKPVAGAIDLVAEPAAGLSRQMKSVDSTSAKTDANAVPERPPRAFRGENQSVDPFDLRYAVGVCLFSAVQLASGVPYSSPLLDWVELSDSEGRRSPDGELWVWNILRRYARSMPGTKRQIRARQQTPSGDRRSRALQTRPEKTRIALITKTEVVVVTIDCRIVTSIPLWDDCSYNIDGQGKEVIVRITLKTGCSSDPVSGTSAFSVGSLISAPWDAPAVGKRRKPEAGEQLVDRVDCGSAEARDDLCTYMRHLTKENGERSGRKLEGRRPRDRMESSSFGVELASMPQFQSQDPNWQELQQTGKDDKDMKSAGFMPIFQPSTNSRGEKMDTVMGTIEEKVSTTISQAPDRAGESRLNDLHISSVREESGSSLRTPKSDTFSQDEVSLKQLIDIGFSFEDSVSALAEAGGDLVKAVDILTQ